MKENLYLYGTEDVPEIPNDIIVRRIELLNDHLTELYEVGMLVRENKRISDIFKAINFWSKLNETK